MKNNFQTQECAYGCGCTDLILIQTTTEEQYSEKRKTRVKFECEKCGAIDSFSMPTNLLKDLLYSVDRVGIN